jgi:hypothetical protein
MKKYLSLLVSFFISFSIFSQNDADYERAYKKGVQEYKMGNYEAALATFNPLTVSKYNNARTPFSYFYYALSANKLNRLIGARLMLYQLQERFPSWSKMDEAQYVLADVLFKEKRYADAMLVLSNIYNPAFNNDKETLKSNHLVVLKDISTLKNLQKQFSKDKTLAMATVRAIQEQSNDASELAWAGQLANNFGTTINVPKPNNIPVLQRNWKKNHYNFAILMPFKVEDMTAAQKTRNNQFVYEMYDGMRLAKNKLRQEGIDINLVSYDVSTAKENATDLFMNPNFLQSDFIVGPIYPEPIKAIREFSEANQIFMLNPVSITNDQLINQRYSLMLLASLDKQATKGFEYMQQQALANNKKVAIYMGAARRDTVLANLYKTKAQAAGYQVIDYRKIQGRLDSLAGISDYNRPGHVVVFSGAMADGAKVQAMMAKRRVSAPILATLTAFDVTHSSGNNLENSNLNFIDPDYVNATTPQFVEFQTNFMNRNNIIPSIYAAQGYDMVLYYGRLLHKYKDKLRDGLNAQTLIKDSLTAGYDFVMSNENQVVPILKFDGTRFQRVND